MTVPSAATRLLDGSRELRVRADDGVRLLVEEFGSPTSASIVFAHGFGQTRQAWQRSAAQIAAEGWRSLSYDARGHGDSDRLPGGEYRVAQLIDDLRLVCRQASAPPVIVGASMGGLVGIAAAGADESICRALVLVDITPRWEPAGVERILAFMRAHPDGFSSLDEAATVIAEYLPHRAGRKSPGRLRHLLTPRDDGRLAWHWDPHMLQPIALDGERHQDELFDAARRIRVPTLLISGAASDVVSETTIAEFMQLVPHARHVSVPHATHMVAGDENHAFTRHVQEFLATLPA